MFRDGAWLRPQYDLLAFYPATPVAWLVKGIYKIMRAEGERVGLWIKVVEESGTLLGFLLPGPTSLVACTRTALRRTPAHLI